MPENPAKKEPVSPDWWQAGYQGPLPEDWYRAECPSCRKAVVGTFAVVTCPHCGFSWVRDD